MGETVAARRRHDEDVERDLALVIDAGRDAIKQELSIADRIDAKARGMLTLAGTWFAVVQGVAGLALREASGATTSTSFRIIITCAIISGFALIASVVVGHFVWKLRDEIEVTDDGLREMATEARVREDFEDRLVRHYGAVLKSRRANNKRRAANFDGLLPVWMLSLALSLVELSAALYMLAQL